MIENLKHILLMLLFGFLFSCETEIDKKYSHPKVTISSVEKDTIFANEPYSIYFKDSKKKIDNYTVLVENSYASKIIHCKLKNNKIKATFPKNLLQKAGVLKYSIFYKTQKIHQKQLFISPLDSIVTMENYNVQKFYGLDISDQPELVTLLIDKHDNGTIKPSVINYEIIKSGEKEDYKSNTEIQYSKFRMPKFSKKGKIIVSSSSDQTTTKHEQYYINSGYTKSFEIFAKQNHDLADNHTVFNLETSILKDNYGNIIDDGTVVEFYFKEAEKKYFKLQSTIQNGVARIDLTHPSSPKKINVTAYCSPNSKSNTMTLEFQSAIQEIPFKLDKRTLTIGPIFTIYNYWVSDDTVVKVTLFDEKNNSRILTLKTIDGIIKYPFSEIDFAKGKYKVEFECLGTKTPKTKIQL